MTETAKVIKFGSFELDNDSQLLYKDGEELALEPKLVEVLQYLLDHRDRYVPLSELHDEVWAGRIVSDTAVRRTISKLRQALDDDVHEPLYIKSLPKRGYRVIADIGGADEATVVEKAEPVTTENNPMVNGATSAVVADVSKSIDAYNDSLNQNTPSSEINYLNSPQSSQARSDNTQSSQLEANSHQQPAPGIASEFNNRDRKSVLPWMVALVAIFVTSLLFIFEAKYKEASIAKPPVSGSISVEDISTIPTLTGSKLSLAVSSDGEQIAYSVKPSGSEVYQLFVQNLASGKVKQFSEGDFGHVKEMSFILDDQAIAFTAQKNNRTDLLVTRLDRDSKELAKTVESN